MQNPQPLHRSRSTTTMHRNVFWSILLDDGEPGIWLAIETPSLVKKFLSYVCYHGVVNDSRTSERVLMRTPLIAIALLTGVACVSTPASKAVVNESVSANANEDKILSAQMRTIRSRMHKGEGAFVRKELAEQAKQSPNNLRVQMLLAWADTSVEDAWQKVNALCKLGPDDPWLWTASGKLYLEWEGFQEYAEQAFDKALKVHPGFVPALVGKADSLRLLGKTEQAKGAYQAILNTNPQWPEAVLGLGLVLAKLGDPQAEKWLEKALAFDASNQEALQALSKVFMESKNIPGAIRMYRAILQSNPQDKNARVALGKLLEESGDLEAASKEYELTMDFSPDPEIARALVRIYGAQNRSDAQIKALERVAQLYKTDPQPWIELGRLYRAQKDNSAAEEAFRQAVKYNPENPEILFEFACLLEENDQNWIEAMNVLRQAKQYGSALAQSHIDSLQSKIGLPHSSIKGNLEDIYLRVSQSLSRRYKRWLHTQPDLAGRLRARVTIEDDGLASNVELVQDTLQVPSLRALVYFSLKDALYPQQKRTPSFEFVLQP